MKPLLVAVALIGMSQAANAALPAVKVSCFLSWQERDTSGVTLSVSSSKSKETTHAREATDSVKSFSYEAKLVYGGRADAAPSWHELQLFVREGDYTAFRQDRIVGPSRHVLSLSKGRESATLLCDITK
jgi:hypothetical protein